MQFGSINFFSPSRSVVSQDLSRLCEWGRLITPIPSSYDLQERRAALRIVLFGSAVRGQMVLQELINASDKNPDQLTIVGVCTDDVRTGRITKTRRLYQYLSDEDSFFLEDYMIATANSRGIPVFTGSVKTPHFKEEILNNWQPDVILGATFGQLVPPEIISSPQYGTYNLHPSDLARGKHPGPNPFQEIINAGETQTRMTLHKMDGDFDTGSVVGFSPEICLIKSDGSYPTNLRMHEHTGALAAKMARFFLGVIAEQRGKIDRINFEPIFTEDQVAHLRMPIEHRTIDSYPLWVRHILT